MNRPMKRPGKFRVIDGAKLAARAKEPSEHIIQRRLCDYLVYAARPDVYFFAIPNQANRHISNALKMRAEGVKSGVADLCFMLPGGRVAWLEMKKPGGVLSETQKAFRNLCKALGHTWAMAKSVDEALVFLTELDALKPAYRKFAPALSRDMEGNLL
jgi:VRR-NUC domain